MRHRIFRWWEMLNLKSSKDWKSAASLVPTVGSLLLGLPVASCGGRTSQPEIQIPPVASEAEFHVAISGSDTDSGTKEHPFASLEKARDSARALHTNTTIWIHAGNHFLTQPFEIGAEDSGVVVRSVEDEAVTLCGAKKISAANFNGVTDAAILARVATEAQGSLMELDLAALGVAHRKPGPDLFTDNGGRVELFVGGRRMPVSRYAWQEVKGGTFARADASLAAGTNMTYAADPGLMKETALNFALHRDAPQFKDLPGFREIPFGKIGLYTDEYRRRLPTPAGAGKVRSPRGREGADYEVLDRE